MAAVTLYRPIGIKELDLIIAADWKKFPPRLFWQPIFYPVLNQPYAEQIALEWNTKDEFSGYCAQHAGLKEYLQNTGDKIIVEASPVDTIWGIGMAPDSPSIENPTSWKGENLLGYALMEVRDQLVLEE